MFTINRYNLFFLKKLYVILLYTDKSFHFKLINRLKKNKKQTYRKTNTTMRTEKRRPFLKTPMTRHTRSTGQYELLKCCSNYHGGIAHPHPPARLRVNIHLTWLCGVYYGVARGLFCSWWGDSGNICLLF